MSKDNNVAPREPNELDEQQLANIQGGLIGDDIGLPRKDGYTATDDLWTKAKQPKRMESVDDDE